MPIIPIDPDYRIASTRLSWELQQRRARKHRKTGTLTDEWTAIRWYPTLESALRDVAELRLRVSEAKDISQALAEVKSLLAGLGRALAGQIEPEVRRVVELVDQEGSR